MSDNAKETNEFCSFNDTNIFNNSVTSFNILDYYDVDTIEAIIKDPMNNNETLRELSIRAYCTNGILTNCVDYMCSMPTLDYVIVPHGSNSKMKKSNKEKMLAVLKDIKHKEFLRDALFKGMIEGIAFYYFETTTLPSSNKKTLSNYDVENITEINEINSKIPNACIIPLSPDYTQIVGIKNSVYQIAFNLKYFNNFQGDKLLNKLKQYPKEIRDAYNKYKRSNTGENWVILDNKKTIVHKIRSKREEKWGRPLVLAAISDISYGNYFTYTKRNILDEMNNKIIYQTFPEGKTKGLSALTDKQQKQQHDSVKSGVLKKNNRGGISFFSVAAGTKINTIDSSNTDIFNDKFETKHDDKIALDLGIAASLLNGSSSGSYSSQENNLDLLSSQLFQWIEQIENELNKCISNTIINDKNNWVECKYLPITHVNKSKMIGYAKDLYLSGRGSLTLWASACGISSDVFFALLDQELEDGIENKYPVHQTSYTMSSKTSEGGRPKTDNPSDNTIKANNNDSNNIPSPSDK